MTIQNLVMANGDPRGGGSGAPRPPTGPVRRRRFLALVVALVATAAVTVPLAYQAHAARASNRPVRDGVSSVPSTIAPRRGPPTEVLPTTTINTTPQLRWARSTPDHGPAAVDGATLSDLVVLWVDADDALRVEFWIDPGPAIRPPELIDDTAPFTLWNDGGASSQTFDTRRLANGPHAIEIRVERRGSDPVRIISRFVVANR